MQYTCHGDTVIFEKAEDCTSGQSCAVMVNGNDATFKKVLKNEAGITLMPINEDEFEPTFYSNKQIKELPVRIIGIAKEIRRKV
ncbi:MAG: S26 family signal peptidase [Clostridiales bacterium]|nr:S26 family signal peptidase [Clostridiales bacterium]